MVSDKYTTYFKDHCRVKDFAGHSSKVHTVAWSCDGKRLASGSLDKTACVFTLEKDRLVKENSFKGHGDAVDQLVWHPSNPQLFATASGDKTMRVWDVRTAKAAATIQTKGENLNITWHPNGECIAVGNKDDLIQFIDTKTFKAKGEKQFKFEVNEISWNNAGTNFFLTTGTGALHVLDYPKLSKVDELVAHTANCISIQFSDCGKYFAVGSADAIVTIWDAVEVMPLRTMSRLEWPVRTLSFSHNGRLLAAASEDHIIDICNVHTGKQVATVPTDNPTFSVAWHPSKLLLAYTCDDKDKYHKDLGNVKLYGLIKE
ncbi:unnamed protein product [Oikopleura dioica]|uniref:Uncharacterized protein n=1 Tax=Oikopleura dioica TaxID=34765 RepID=E4YIP5_OIKDI|nr:unnamed protein product [Oikopleura dioica]